MTKEEIEEYDRLDEAIRDENVGLLAGFKDWLIAKKTTPKMIEKHIVNTKIYMDYLLRYEALSSKNYEDLGGFFDYYDRKVIFTTTKAAYTALKKYYAFLYENKLADDEIMEEVKEAKGYFE